MAGMCVLLSGMTRAADAYAVQAGSFVLKEGAERLNGYIESKGIECDVVEQEGLFKVRCGENFSREQASSLRRKLGEISLKDSFVVRTAMDTSFLEEGREEGPFTVQAGSFSRLENARASVLDLKVKKVGCRILLRDGLYKVHCGKFRTKERASSAKDEIAAFGYKDAFIAPFASGPVVTPGKTAEEEMPQAPREPEETPSPGPLIPKVKAAAPEVSTIEPEADVSEAPYRASIPADILGRKGGHFHPLLSVFSLYTDNLYRSPTDPVSDYETITTAGLSIMAPGSRDVVSVPDVAPSVPGGRGSGEVMEIERRYLALLSYRADLERFRDNPSEDFDHHSAAALLALRGRGGLSLTLTEQYATSHDARGTGIPGELFSYETYLGTARLSYDFGRLRARADYADLDVDYEEAFTDYKDRKDRALSGYLYYDFSSRTSAFLQYETIDIDYERDVMPDAREDIYFGGLQWDITAKSSGLLKAGYGVRDFEDPSLHEARHFVLSGNLRHRLTSKTLVDVILSRRREESDIQNADFLVTENARAGVFHVITPRVLGAIVLSYSGRKYEPGLTFGGATKERKDDVFEGSLSFSFKPYRWLTAETGYEYSERNSTFPDFEFENNRAYFRITAAF